MSKITSPALGAGVDPPSPVPTSDPGGARDPEPEQPRQAAKASAAVGAELVDAELQTQVEVFTLTLVGPIWRRRELEDRLLTSLDVQDAVSAGFRLELGRSARPRQLFERGLTPNVLGGDESAG